MFYRAVFTEESSFMGWLIAVSRACEVGEAAGCVKSLQIASPLCPATSCANQEAALGCSTTTLSGAGSTINRKRFDHMRNASRFSSSYSWTL